MRSQCFDDFDAFAESVQGVESKMMLHNPKRQMWRISSLDLDGMTVQVGQLGSGNIALAEIRPTGCLLYLPLTDGVEYSANGIVLEKNSFAILEPGCEVCVSTKVEHDWCAVFIPTDAFASGGPLGAVSGGERATVRGPHGPRSPKRCHVFWKGVTATRC
jgi:hypothetical protein